MTSITFTRRNRAGDVVERWVEVPADHGPVPYPWLLIVLAGVVATLQVVGLVLERAS